MTYNVFMDMNVKNNPLQPIVSLLESFSPLARLEILLLIGAGEACVCHLETRLGYRQAYISQHLMALRQAGLLASRRNGKYIFYAGGMDEHKNLRVLFSAYAEIQKEVPSKLMMVGEGPEKEGAEQLCEQLGIQNKVIFFGNSNEIDKILCFSDLFLLPSETESFGLAALEAMACEVPVVSTNAGGLREVNEDGFSGFTCNVGDIQALSDAVLKIILDQETLNQFKKNAKVQAQKFDIKIVLKEYIDYYNEIYNI